MKAKYFDINWSVLFEEAYPENRIGFASNFPHVQYGMEIGFLKGFVFATRGLAIRKNASPAVKLGYKYATEGIEIPVFYDKAFQLRK